LQNFRFISSPPHSLLILVFASLEDNIIYFCCYFVIALESLKRWIAVAVSHLFSSDVSFTLDSTFLFLIFSEICFHNPEIKIHNIGEPELLQKYER
jgi:hypothetical protein